MVSLRRRILYIIFILAFLIITPLVSLYAAGYKIGAGFSIQKTGILILNTEPTGANIYLNGKIQKSIFKNIFKNGDNLDKTPIKIKNLKPGDYNVKIELDGYWPWEKKLSIKPGESTFAEDIYLFKIEFPVLKQAGDYKKLSSSPNKENIVLVSETQIDIFNTVKNNIKSFKLSPETLDPENIRISWIDNQNAIVGNFIFNDKKWDEPINLFKTIGKEIKNITWGKNEDNIIFSIGNQIISYDLSKNKSKTVLKGSKFKKFIFKSDSLLILQNENDSSVLTIKNIESEAARKINLPLSDYKVEFNSNNLITLLDEKYNILYIIDPFSYLKPFKETINGVKKFSWINDKQLIYSNDFEIWIADTENYEKKLITRIAEIINEVIWHPTNNYAIYSTDHNIYSIELDDREKYNITKLIELDYIKNPSLNKKGNIIYFISEINSKKGLYNLTIQ